MRRPWPTGDCPTKSKTAAATAIIIIIIIIIIIKHRQFTY
jgi:hypothetical protein